MSEISEIIKTNSRKNHFVECTLLGGIICPMIRINKNDLYVWGGGLGIEALVGYFNDNDIDVKGVIDSDELNMKTHQYLDIPYLDFDKVINYLNLDYSI